MQNANLELTKLSMAREKNDTFEISVNITESTFGQIEASNGFQISIFECQLKHVGLGITLIKATGSRVTMRNSIFKHLAVVSGAAALNAIASEVVIQNTIFRASSSVDGLIHITNNSMLSMTNCTFTKNNSPKMFPTRGSAVSVSSNSSAFVSNCSFTHNAASYGACFYLSDCVEFTVEDSTINDNHALEGAVIYSVNTLQHSTKTKVIINTSLFKLNYALFTGGVLHMESSSAEVYITDTIFNTDAAFYGGAGGAICAMGGLSGRNNKNSTYGQGYLENAQINIFVSNSYFHEMWSFTGVFNIYQGVTLTVTNSSFVGVGPLGMLFGAKNNCSVTVEGCYIENTKYFLNMYAVIFSIENNSTLTVVNSSLVSKSGCNLFVLTAWNNSQISFISCSFHKINGFQAIHGSDIFIGNSSITETLHSFHSNGFIEISDKSNLLISHTNVKQNNIREVSSFIFAEKKSSVSLLSFHYVWNTMSAHIKIVKNSNITIHSSTFVNNSVVDRNGKILKGILVGENSNVSVERTDFHQNSLQSYLLTTNHVKLIAITKCKLKIKRSQFISNDFYFIMAMGSTMELILVNSSKNLFFAHNIFIKNKVNQVLHVMSEVEISKSYLQIDNCSFAKNWGQSVVTGIEHVMMHQSYFEIFDFWKDSLLIKGAKSAHIMDSIFNQTMDTSPLRFSSYHPQRIKFFTLNTTFIRGNFTLKSNTKNFMKLAEREGFINVFSPLRLEHKESEFASSK